MRVKTEHTWISNQHASDSRVSYTLTRTRRRGSGFRYKAVLRGRGSRLCAATHSGDPAQSAGTHAIRECAVLLQ